MTTTEPPPPGDEAALHAPTPPAPAPDADGPRGADGRVPRSLLANAITVALVLSIALLFVACALVVVRSRSRGVGCRNNLKQIALAAMQYCDDKRFFPHVHKLTALDGDESSNDGPVSLRSLHFFDYLDQPATFVCPASPDTVPRVGDGYLIPQALPPPATVFHFTQPCPTLVGNTQLSYGWTRRGFTSRSLSSNILAADRSSLHHRGTRMIVHLDAHTAEVKDPDPDFGRLGSCEDKRDGFLAIFAEEVPSPSPPRTELGLEEAAVLAACALVLASGVSAFVVSRRRRRA